MHEGTAAPWGLNRLRNIVRSQRGCQRHEPTCESFAHAQNIRVDAVIQGAEHLPGAAERGGNLIGDQQQTVPAADALDPLHHRWIVEAHAPGTLHYRFDDDSRD